MPRYVGHIPMPRFIVLEDRDDGTNWVVSWSGNRVSIDSEGLVRSGLRDRTDFTFYPAGQEPIIDTEPGVRIIVRGGRLGYEVVEDPLQPLSARVWARKGVNRRWFDLKRHSQWFQTYMAKFRRGLQLEELLP